jgi:hypothetical protein
LKILRFAQDDMREEDVMVLVKGAGTRSGEAKPGTLAAE